MTEQNESTGISINTGNEISKEGRFFAGLLFILFIALCVLSLIAYWPDRLPRSDNGALYRNDLFNVILLDSLNRCDSCFQTTNAETRDSATVNPLLRERLGANTLTDSTAIARRGADSLRLSDSLYKVFGKTQLLNNCCNNTITLNTLLLILVAIAGFLGTMIHIATSFTNFVGAEKFKKSWTLWYVIKPFTGAALAMIIYFIFRAGLLNFNDTSNINLYGIITLAALAGLFTDKATLKLEEVFEVIFKPKDERPDKLDTNAMNVKITGIKPQSLLSSIENQLVISGQGFDKRKFVIKIDEDEIKNPVIKADAISFSYKLPEGNDKKEFALKIFDEKGKEIYSGKLLKGEAPAAPAAPAVPPQAPPAADDTERLNQEEFGDADDDDDINKPQD